MNDAPKQTPNFLGSCRSVADAAQQVLTETAEPQRYIGGGEILLGLATIALFRWVWHKITYSRALDELELVKQLLDLGYPRKDATAVAAALVAGRKEDDAMLQKALAFTR